MLVKMVALTLLTSALGGSLFLWFVYGKQYRFSTLMFDMLPFYPMLVLLGAFLGISSCLYLSLNGFDILIWLIPSLLIIFSVQFTLFWKWMSSYRLAKYSKLIQRLSNSPKLRVIKIDEWIDQPKKDPNRVLILIRHDVDTNLNRAKNMFVEEKRFNIPSCYYFRNNAERYTLDEAHELINNIAASDISSVGFHYETITNANGDIAKAAELFHWEVEQFRQIYPIRVVAAHGDKSHNSRLVSEKIVNLKSLNLISSYQLPYDLYLSDAGGSHHFRNPDNGRETVSQRLAVIDQIAPGSLVQILIHPDWWF